MCVLIHAGDENLFELYILRAWLISLYFQLHYVKSAACWLNHSVISSGVLEEAALCIHSPFFLFCCIIR